MQGSTLGLVLDRGRGQDVLGDWMADNTLNINSPLWVLDEGVRDSGSNGWLRCPIGWSFVLIEVVARLD